MLKKLLSETWLTLACFVAGGVIVGALRGDAAYGFVIALVLGTGYTWGVGEQLTKGGK